MKKERLYFAGFSALLILAALALVFIGTITWETFLTSSGAVLLIGTNLYLFYRNGKLGEENTKLNEQLENLGDEEHY